MPEWKYGGHHEKHPIERGDIWAVGPHLFSVCDVEAGDAAALCKARPEFVADHQYTDPPWDKGNARAFRTKAIKGGTPLEDRPVDFFGSLIPKFVHLSSLVRGSIGFEMGKEHVDQTVEMLRVATGRDVVSTQIIYHRKFPCMLIGVGLKSGIERYSNIDDAITPLMFVETETAPGESVSDFCVGLGTTPWACAKAGRLFRGSDLNKHRVASSMARIAEMIGEQPKKVGSWL